MTSKLILFVLPIFLLFLSINCFAQKDPVPAYVITSKADTIHGLLLEEKGSAESINFKPSGSSNFLQYLAKDIEGYGTNDGLHHNSKEISVDGNTRIVFLKVVVKGPVKLYSGKGIQKNIEFYIQKADAPVVQLHKTHYKGTVASVCGDCEGFEVSNRGSSKRLPSYNAPSLANFVQNYSNCQYPTEESEIYLTQSRVGVSYGVKAAFQSTGLRLDSDFENTGEFNTVKNFSAGIFANIHVPGKRLSIQPELSYVKHNFESSQDYQQPFAPDYTLSFSYNTALLQVPLLLKYTFGKDKIQPFINAGPSISFIVSNDVHRMIAYETGHTTKQDIKSPNSVVGYTGGVGLKYMISKRKALHIELRYSKDVANNNTDNMKAVFSGYQLATAFTL